MLWQIKDEHDRGDSQTKKQSLLFRFTHLVRVYKSFEPCEMEKGQQIINSHMVSPLLLAPCTLCEGKHTMPCITSMLMLGVTLEFIVIKYDTKFIVVNRHHTHLDK